MGFNSGFKGLMSYEVERTGDKTNAYRVLVGKPE